MKSIPLILATALVLGGCASSYQLTLMPRDSGKLYYGTADDIAGGDGRVSITIETTTYNGTWVQTRPDRTYGYVAGGYGGWGGRGWGGWGVGGTMSMDNPEGSAGVALLQSPTGSGLRCEFRGSGYGLGGGTCRDDKGMEYDVQIRPRKTA